MMNLKSVIFILILIKVANNKFVKGLQCYVCKDCNEYEDFKELHICGEIPIEVTVKPSITEPEITGTSTTRRPIRRTSVASTTKPSEKTTIDDYLYEDSDEKTNNIKVQNSTQTNTTTQINTTVKSTTRQATSLKPSSSTQRTTTLTEKPTPSTTTQSLPKESIADNKTTTRTITTTSTATTTTTAITTTIKSLPDYDDYLEYEDTLRTRRREGPSLLKMNEPVCYMIKYRVNNTIITNRGCTTFIKSNRYSTCKSLYNGIPMESCRVCSSNGCNKFLDEDGYEDNYGTLFNAAAGAPKQLPIFISLLFLTFGQAIF